ncbi:MAG: glycosyltransferase family 4 protein [Planctomycetota bacterium]|nr:glycosyltransferase family 4 protein [Planctomycetota bacterium]
MKILFLSSEFPPETGFGGIGTYVAHLAPALAARGHTVTVLSRTLGKEDTEARVDGVRVVRVADREAPPEVWQPPFDPRVARQAKSHYDRAFTVALALQDDPSLADVDIIEAADWAGEAALVRAMLPDVPYVVKFHTPAKLVFAWNESGVSGAFIEALHKLESVAVHNAMGFTCPSRWMIGACEELFEIPPGHVRAIPNPFAAGPVAPRRTAPERRVLYVGRLEARKGVVEAVAPMCRVLRALPDVHWRLAGADTNSAPGGGSMKAALAARIPEDLRARVHFLGALDRVALGDELASANAVLLPSRHENFPYACLEAMAAGAAVVASRNGGMAEMIESGRTGLLVDPKEPGTVIDALLRVLEQPFFASELGRAAAAVVHERYRPDVVAPLVEQHYASVLATPVST